MGDKIDINKICSDKKRIGISGHIRPDGDCVGSTLALSAYLKNRFPDSEVTVYLEEPSDIFSCIKGFEKLNHDFMEEEAHDVFFVLDCESERLGQGKKYFEAAKIKVNIDHHSQINNEKPSVQVQIDQSSNDLWQTNLTAFDDLR